MLSKGTGKELKKYLSDYVIVDIETTGMANDNDEIIRISAMSFMKNLSALPRKISSNRS